VSRAFNALRFAADAPAPSRATNTDRRPRADKKYDREALFDEPRIITEPRSYAR
jgi:hypothetical protein